VELLDRYFGRHTLGKRQGKRTVVLNLVAAPDYGAIIGGLAAAARAPAIGAVATERVRVGAGCGHLQGSKDVVLPAEFRM